MNPAVLLQWLLRGRNSNTGVLTNSHVFQPVALETLAAMDSSTSDCLSALGRRSTDTSGDPRETIVPILAATFSYYPAFQLCSGAPGFY